MFARFNTLLRPRENLPFCSVPFCRPGHRYRPSRSSRSEIALLPCARTLLYCRRLSDDSSEVVAGTIRCRYRSISCSHGYTRGSEPLQTRGLHRATESSSFLRRDRLARHRVNHSEPETRSVPWTTSFPRGKRVKIRSTLLSRREHAAIWTLPLSSNYSRRVGLYNPPSRAKARDPSGERPIDSPTRRGEELGARGVGTARRRWRCICAPPLSPMISRFAGRIYRA